MALELVVHGSPLSVPIPTMMMNAPVRMPSTSSLSSKLGVFIPLDCPRRF
jgi:hypothetical protein